MFNSSGILKIFNKSQLIIRTYLFPYIDGCMHTVIIIEQLPVRKSRLIRINNITRIYIIQAVFGRMPRSTNNYVDIYRVGCVENHEKAKVIYT